MKNKGYEVKINWKLSPRSPVAYEETFAVEAVSREAAMIQAGFALARFSVHARNVTVTAVSVTRSEDEVQEEVTA